MVLHLMKDKKFGGQKQRKRKEETNYVSQIINYLDCGEQENI